MTLKRHGLRNYESGQQKLAEMARQDDATMVRRVVTKEMFRQKDSAERAMSLFTAFIQTVASGDTRFTFEGTTYNVQEFAQDLMRTEA